MHPTPTPDSNPTRPQLHVTSIATSRRGQHAPQIEPEPAPSASPSPSPSASPSPAPSASPSPSASPLSPSAPCARAHPFLRPSAFGRCSLGLSTQGSSTLLPLIMAPALRGCRYARHTLNGAPTQGNASPTWCLRCGRNPNPNPNPNSHPHPHPHPHPHLHPNQAAAQILQRGWKCPHCTFLNMNAPILDPHTKQHKGFCEICEGVTTLFGTA